MELMIKLGFNEKKQQDKNYKADENEKTSFIIFIM